MQRLIVLSPPILLVVVKPSMHPMVQNHAQWVIGIIGAIKVIGVTRVTPIIRVIKAIRVIGVTRVTGNIGVKPSAGRHNDRAKKIAFCVVLHHGMQGGLNHNKQNRKR